MHKLLATMGAQNGSDLFISANIPPSMKANGQMQPLISQKLTEEKARVLARSQMNE